MPSTSSAPPAAAAASSAAPASLGNNKGIKFQIKTGGARWECTLQDRSQYERMKALRSDSTDSTDSNDSSNSSTAESK
ncbi:uncharacterized protein TrAFT101_001055 [Trichoderma asperellum]|uniref:Uncharacterized protein n=1 Tax=Trichoderma asperellum (strain ATCC 204424 / CBS 433.97 / NBRC 101777) TaxID=1042311 RepID=A0A2T3ZLE5_TRIA4|nr:hypothetical protein M441DRAFT_23788 [Trichoderma asperellum CBS 433.97]PTB45621.1 hypothetical protein M441DRAFT_23788 [Trichoderma asperellum CBS 433.97]UKZ85187.1 hypothetical protein TrAFT101_001055 [Trichoderma asperellum]